jgi:hypothetical protein
LRLLRRLRVRGRLRRRFARGQAGVEVLAHRIEAASLSSQFARPLLDNPGRVMSIAALAAAVLAGGLYAGFELRKRRLGTQRNPYRAYERDKVRDTETGTDYGAVGI